MIWILLYIRIIVLKINSTSYYIFYLSCKYFISIFVKPSRIKIAICAFVSIATLLLK